ncbi:4'-phosphopantetheinyl transferase family protein [Leptolyngbya sp. Cla-17]|uniref:4'-phosphopantetheinyl transferase family protein n=1 Tax=Leptolyngbya sp. Cla-17 TaxID=2803751 RepID=UPI0017E508D4|nr:4'-phosphopantetheinyl transferase superfamily protein [Leptolyngbya sp. Cla-17]
MNDRSTTIANHEISHPQWQTAADWTQLVSGCVHIWQATSCQSPQILGQLLQTLSQDEQNRAGRLRFDHHRYRAIASRGILRSILARYLNCDPEAVQFQYGPQGKPMVDTRILPNLEFNLSHSQDVVVCAIALQPVGIDVEFFREITYCDQLIQRYFSVQEQAMLNSLSVEAKRQAFFHYWTCKEAMLKALGFGISDLKRVELNPMGKRMQLSSVTGCHQLVSSWHLHSFEPAPNYLASIAIELPTMQLKYWQW